MKKIFTLLAGVALATGLTASADVLDMPHKATLKATPEMMRMVDNNFEMMHEAEAQGVTPDRVVKKVYVQGTDTYSIQILNTGIRLTDWWIVQNKEYPDSIPFFEIPYFVVQYVLTCTDINHNLRYRADCLTSWPTYATWDLVGGKGNFKIVQLDEIATRRNEGLCSTFGYYDENAVLPNYDSGSKQITAYPIWSNRSKGRYQTCENDTRAKFAAPTPSRMSKFVIMSYDDEEKTINSSNEFYFVNSRDESIGSMIVRYDGTARFQGFKPINMNYDLSSLHIFNAGLKDPSVLGRSENPYDFDWNPQMKFWIYGPTKDNHIEIDVRPDDKRFNSKLISFNWNDDVPQSDRINDNYYAFYGPIYAPATAEDPYGVYQVREGKSVPDPDFPDEKIIEMYPTDYSVIPRGYDYKWSEDDGLKIMWQAFYQYLRYPAQIGIGTDRGFFIKGADAYGNKINSNYTGEIVYHYDPSDMTLTRNIPSVGSINGVTDVVESDFGVMIEKGGVVVDTLGASEVNVYSISGVKVASVVADGKTHIALNPGVYVVMAGGKCVKVAVK